ncbi:thioesterase II family protein [Streptomyces sp. NPDC048527]|uniref:thioesterase II family protein n=1 Tax=Streptomyces sp. NPDC048527 TaxID=3365568 RepID=UPI00371AE2B5
MRQPPHDPARRVVVFPHSGAGPNTLLPLVEQLPAEYEVLGVTLPGRERRFAESPEVAPSDLVAAVGRELTALKPCPTLFFGHSLGASIAVAVALAEPATCSALLVSAQLPGGSQIERSAEWDDADLLRVMEQGDGTPAELLADPVWLEHTLQLLRADLQLGGALGKLSLQALPAVPLTVLGGSQDRLVPAERLAEWSARASVDVRVKLFPGGHFYLLDQANIAAVAAEIAAPLECGDALPGAPRSAAF